MNKTKTIDSDNKITVDINGLMGLTSVGRGTAEKIAENAGAVIRVGRRKLYNVEKVQSYLDSLSKSEGKMKSLS